MELVHFTVLVLCLLTTSAYDVDDENSEELDLETDSQISESQRVARNPIQIALNRIYEIKRNQEFADVKFVMRTSTTTEMNPSDSFRYDSVRDFRDSEDVKTDGIAIYRGSPLTQVKPLFARGKEWYDTHDSTTKKFKNPRLEHSNQTCSNKAEVLKFGRRHNGTSQLRYKWPNNRSHLSRNLNLENVVTKSHPKKTPLSMTKDMYWRYRTKLPSPELNPVSFFRNDTSITLNGSATTIVTERITSLMTERTESIMKTTTEPVDKELNSTVPPNRYKVLGLDSEMWRSEKLPQKQMMAQKMLLTNSGPGFSHYLSNVPKLNRDLKPVHPKDDTSLADALAAKVRVLCWVITHPGNHKKLPIAIKETWGRKCTKLIFFSTEYDKTIPTVKLFVREGRDYLWGKMKAAILHIHTHHRHDADWFLRTDDDTYIIMENLRYLLGDYDSREPLYLGCRFRPYSPQGYMSGGAGMVISKEALDRVVKRGLKGPHLCEEGDEGDDDDAKIGLCLHRVGVKAVDTRDSEQRGRFWPFGPQDHVLPHTDTDFWYWRYTYYPNQYGIDCCSDYSVSFHYQSAADMYAMEFLIYKLRPYGIQYGMADPPRILRNGRKRDNITRVRYKNGPGVSEKKQRQYSTEYSK